MYVELLIYMLRTNKDIIRDLKTSLDELFREDSSDEEGVFFSSGVSFMGE